MGVMPGLGWDNGVGGGGGARRGDGNTGGRAILKRKGTKFHVGPELLHQKCSLSTYSPPELVLGNRSPTEMLSVCPQESPRAMQEAEA